MDYDKILNKFNTSIQNRINDTVLDNLLKKGIKVAPETLERVIKSQWEFLTFVMRMGEHESLRLKYLGNFGVKTYREEFGTIKYLTYEQRMHYNTLNFDEKLVYLTEINNEFKERTKEQRSALYRKVIVLKNGKVLKTCTLQEASDLSGIPPIHVLISCSKRTKTRNNYSFLFDESEEENQDSGADNIS